MAVPPLQVPGNWGGAGLERAHLKEKERVAEQGTSGNSSTSSLFLPSPVQDLGGGILNTTSILAQALIDLSGATHKL